jgi:flagellar M-ring protein FliF
MGNFFTSLRTQFVAASAGAKLALFLGVAALVAVFALAGSWASKPSFKLLYSGLDAPHAAAVQSALAGASVRYEVSQPPAPFFIHVDEAQYYAAQNAVAVSGALVSAPEGIQTNGSGASQVFLSASERAQNVQKRDWQELEKQLEELDFVQRAHVSTSVSETSALRKSPPMTVAVTLTLKGGTELSKAQSTTVAKLVRYRFNVPQENVMIADQSGRSLFDGASSSDITSSELLDNARRHDEDLAIRTNQLLDRVFGVGMAYVAVNSEWSYAQTESVKETVDPKKVVLSETTNKSSTPVDNGSDAGGIAGTGSNLAAEFGSSNAAVPAVKSAGSSDAMATSNESQKSYAVGRETRLDRNNAPKLSRMSVSLFLDESRKDRLKDLESSVKASIGFDDKRGDTFSSMVTAFASLKRDERGQPVPPAAPPEVAAPNRMTEMLIQRGIEIAAAVAFLFLLFKTLKGASKAAAETAAKAAEAKLDPQAMQLLAKTEIEELVKTDPALVSSILSRWAADEEPVGAGR